MKNEIFNRSINKLFPLSHLKIIFRDIRKIFNTRYSNRQHLDSAMQWLCNAQDNSFSGKFSEGYFFNKSWKSSHPTATGGIISTFLEYSLLNENNEYKIRAIRLADCEIKRQLASGVVKGKNDDAIVLTNGLTILAWNELYKHTKLQRFLDASINASNWLIKIINDEGKWSSCPDNRIAHSYNSIAAWSLLEVHNHTHNDLYKSAAIQNISWILTQAKENGWFERMSFCNEEPPLTDMIGYTLRGLLESSFYLEGEIKQKTQSVVTKAALQIMRRYELQKKDPYSLPSFLPARLNEQWKSDVKYSCLAGNAQIAILWLRLCSFSNDMRFLNASLKMIDQLKSTQNTKSRNPRICGGIKDFYPIFGSYLKFSYSNSATKFFADAVMLQEKVMQRIEHELL